MLSGTARQDPRQAWLAQRGVPFVGFGRMWSGRQIGDWVDVDGASGTDAAVEHLVALGHRRIAFLGWPRGSGVGDDRAEGWQRAMRRHGLPTRGRRAQSVDDIDSARSAIKPMLDAGVTAVVAASDMLALGCYHALRERESAPGRDVSVIGFDDSPTAAILSPTCPRSPSRWRRSAGSAYGCCWHGWPTPPRHLNGSCWNPSSSSGTAPRGASRSERADDLAAAR